MSGSGFGTDAGSVKFGDISASISSWSDTEIVVVAPTLPPANYDIKVHVPSTGCAVGTDGYVTVVLSKLEYCIIQ